MELRIHTPSGPLSRYIDNIVYYEDYRVEYNAFKLLPDGSIYIILDMEDAPKKLFYDETLTRYQECSKHFVSGQHKHFLYRDAQCSSMMVVKFLIGGAYPFFDFPVSTLNNKVMQLENFYGSSIADVREEILNEKDIDKKIGIMERFLLDRMKDEMVAAGPLAVALKQIQEDPDNTTTKSLAEKAGITSKHLIDLFHRKVGLTPKALIRIFRFQRVISRIEDENKIDWTKMAYECGYYDQAHFIKDFYEFSGLRPSEYPGKRGEYVNYLPME